MTSASPPLLSLSRITVLRGDREQRPALNDITLQIGTSEHVCILAPHGCGKSTLIKTITREGYPLAAEGPGISILGRARGKVFEMRSVIGLGSPDALPTCTP